VFGQKFGEISHYSYIDVSFDVFFDTLSFVLHDFEIESVLSFMVNYVNSTIIDCIYSNITNNVYVFVILYFADYNLSDYNLSNYNSMCRTYLTARKLNYQ
jgi:hypothetical protein